MTDKPLNRYLFASDFDQTLSFNASGYGLIEVLGVATEDFGRKVKGMAKINLVQQGAKLAYLLLHDPKYQTRVRRKHLYEAGKRIRLKQNIELLGEILKGSIEGYHFDFYVLSAAPWRSWCRRWRGSFRQIMFMGRNSVTAARAKSKGLYERPRVTGKFRRWTSYRTVCRLGRTTSFIWVTGVRIFT